MPARTVKAAAIQLAPDLNSGARTLEKILDALDVAARAGVEIAVFPETVMPYYPYFSFVRPPVQSGAEHLKLYEEAVVVPGPVTETIGAAARRHGMVVVMGVNERDHGTIYNAQLIFDANGELVLKRRKITPTFHERMIWGMGDGSGLHCVETAVGRRRRTGLLGALQPAGALRPDGRSRSRFTARSFQDRWSGRSLPTRWKSPSAITRLNRDASSSMRPAG